MRKALPLILALLSVAACAQTTTTYPLPSTVVDEINYGTYINLFADDIPVTINGVPYYVSFTAQTDEADNCLSICNISFWNLNTNAVSNLAYVSGPGSASLFTGSFSGAFNGTFTLNIVTKIPKPPCGRYGCRPFRVQQNSTLTLVTN